MNVIPLRPVKGQGSDPPAAAKYTRSAALRLTDAESMRLRAALRNMRGLFGTWACLADAMGVKLKTLEGFVHGRGNGSPAMALAAARAAGLGVDALLGAPRIAGTCPHCGATWEVRT